MSWKAIGSGWQYSATVPAGSTRTILLRQIAGRGNPSISIRPASGGSATCLMSISHFNEIDEAANTGGTFVPLDHPNADASGVVVHATPIVIDSPLSPLTALRITATSADCAVEILQ